MNYIYQRVIWLFCFFSTIHGQSISLNKIFHHSGIGQKSSSIELGNVVLYVDQYPKVIKMVEKQGNTTLQTFFMPDVETISSEAADAINRINNQKNSYYAITIAPVTSPQKGLKITIAYDDQHIGIKRHRYDSISLQKSIVFRVYNNKLINDIKQVNKPIIQTACNSHPNVIIDCGHGGTDYGAVGCFGIKEKDISLQVGLQVAALLKEKNVSVQLTRTEDQTLLLDERTSFANAQQADLFVSIHANAAPNKTSTGVETYCLQENLFEDVFGDGFCILDKQLQTKYQRSYQLAQTVHRSILSAIPSEYGVIDRRVKYNVAQVLLGTVMPAILVEIGYVTHEKEANLLAQSSYQSFIAHGIVHGINSYLEQFKSA
jgi:N-acetylmuramoyl-L-alanine amidase